MQTKTFPISSQYTLDEAKRKSIQLYAYTNRLTDTMIEYLPDDCAIALFDKNSCLLKLYGNPSILNLLETTYGIKRMTNWSEEAIGPNPISSGLKLLKPMSTSDFPDGSSYIENLSISFSPCTRQDQSTPNMPEAFGGIAIITTRIVQNTLPMFAAISASADLSLHMFMANSMYMARYSEENGMITIDINTKNGKKNIIYYDANIFSIFGLDEKSNLYFTPAEQVFDPLPDNKEFWNIINSNQRVTHYLIDITTCGHTGSYQITTNPYNRSDLSLRGMHVYVVSRQSLLSRISRNTGYAPTTTFADIIGQSPTFLNTIRQAKTIAKTDNNVLIIGETGTGKDILAQAMHNSGSRKNGPFIVVNCASYPPEMLLQTLFGNTFTDNDSMDSIGQLELANHGTLMLNDIEALPLGVQSALMQFIETKSFRYKRNQINVDVKIIAASSADLVALTKEKKFRSDLYYRLNTLHLRIPPLRERSVDISILADYFVSRFHSNINSGIQTTLSTSAKRLVSKLAWSGNVRELRNTMEGIIQIYPSLEEISPDYILDYMGSSGTLPRTYESYEGFIQASPKLLTKEILTDALEACKYNKMEAAKRLGISRRTLYRYIDKFEL